MSEIKNKENAKSAFSAAAIFMLLYLAYKRSKVDDELGRALLKVKKLLFAFMIWAFVISTAFAIYSAFMKKEFNLSFACTILYLPFLFILLKWLFGGEKGKMFFLLILIIGFLRLLVILICCEPITNLFNFG